MGFSLTDNRRDKLAAMEALGFKALPVDPYNTRHQRVRCSCGKELPYYRVDIARKHQATCGASAPQPAVQWDGAGNIPRKLAEQIAHYFGELAQHPMQGKL